MIPFVHRSIDTDPHPFFPIYSAGNFAEVAPPRWSPMSWSLIGDPVERALRSLLTRISPRAHWHTGSHYVFVGYFACRPYHNLSAFTYMTAQVPGLDASALTDSYFEGVAPPASPRLRPRPLQRLAGGTRVLRELARLQPRLSALDARTHDTEAQVRAACAQPRAAALGMATAAAEQLLNQIWSLHYDTTALIITLRSLVRAIGERVLPWWEEVEPWISRPGELAWAPLQDAAAAGVDHGELLRFPFYEVADHLDPWTSQSQPQPQQFPPSERRALEHDPVDALWSMIPPHRLAGLPNVVALLEDMMCRREASKSLAMRVLHLFRVLLPPLARDAGTPEDLWPYLRISELVAPSCRVRLTDLACERRELCLAALAERMPEQLAFSSPGAADSPQLPARAGRGRGVSPGVVTGVVVSSALEECNGDPRILVCDRADIDVQHLLGRVDGLVTARGSALSHVAVIVREYGIPAVVASPLAGVLRAGQRITVDGTNGSVEVL